MAVNKSGLNPMGRNFFSSRTPLFPIALGVIVVCGLVDVCGSAQRLSAADPFERYDLMMYRRPELPIAEVKYRFPDGLKELWGKALERPDPELQYTIIDTIADAHVQGMEEMESFVPKLIELAREPDQSLDVARSVAGALITLESREHAEFLAQLVDRYGPAIGKHVEPALARWKSSAMREQWRERIQSGALSDSELLLAIHGAGEIGMTEASEVLEQWVQDGHLPTSRRVASARALGMIQRKGLQAAAEELLQQAEQSPGLGGILAVELLRHHSSEQAIEVLAKLARTEPSVVQSEALKILLSIDPELVDEHIDGAIVSDDVNVRRTCMDTVAAAPKPNRVEQLAILLDDVNPNLRRDVSTLLIRLAEDEKLRPAVIAGTKTVLDQNSWRGCEQACFVMGKLDHKDAGRRIVELLPHPRGEVRVASAWALTQLRIESLLPDMLEHGEDAFRKFKDGTYTAALPGYTQQFAHLFQAFGDQKYKPAKGLMKGFLPKSYSLGEHARPAAAWAFGIIYEGEPVEDLVAGLEKALLDSDSLMPEMEPVRLMCAISLARMEAKSTLPSIQKYAQGTSGVAMACHWALERLLGTPMPQIPSVTVTIDDWILSPIK